MNAVHEFLTFLGPWSIVTAVASGFALALVVSHLRPLADVRLSVFLVITSGMLWYAPLTIQRALDSGVPESAALRTLGALVLYLVGFATPMAATLHWRSRR